MYVCEKACQVRINGRIVTFAKGDLADLEKDHRHFRNLEEGGVDFETAKEPELLEAEYDLDDLKAFIKERYGKNPRNRNKENTVKMLLDCRYRDIGEADLKRVI